MKSNFEQAQRVTRLYLSTIADNCQQATELMGNEVDRKTIDHVFQLLDQADKCLDQMQTDSEVESVVTANQQLIISLQIHQMSFDAIENTYNGLFDDDNTQGAIGMLSFANKVANLFNFCNLWIMELANHELITLAEAQQLLNQLTPFRDKISNYVPILEVSPIDPLQTTSEVKENE